MEDKKMPFAVFVLEYVENMVKDYENSYEALNDLLGCCAYCPLKDECDGGWSDECLKKLKERVESAE